MLKTTASATKNGEKSRRKSSASGNGSWSSEMINLKLLKDRPKVIDLRIHLNQHGEIDAGKTSLRALTELLGSGYEFKRMGDKIGVRRRKDE